MKRAFLAIGVVAALALLDPQRARRAVFMATLFHGVDMTREFGDMQGLFPTLTVHTSSATRLAEAAEPIPLPETYEFEGETRRIRTFLEETDTSGFLVLKDGEIVHEEYALGSSRETRWIFWSVAKRFVSARRMEEDAYWITDEAGMEFAFGGLNATLRDYARFGEPELRQRRNDGSRDRITRPVQRDRAIDRPLNTIRFEAVLASTQP